ncbi:PREDICTED: NAD-dependent protein deacetylase sirtuin-1 isoform X1 [Nicrophorus vespilloides]|uniref:NAD-dependent protein deacetylase sirtuin-1 isoform X1 n=2 Tax=Nicrophorus vespilloides TaxID=110193 RepID=A0ABM1ME77_NICVS|nr:PREDICTED: NAD-dependent protein deacetylase sirtuin-1 isoform X1 [Nicrophorus vespilloides]
MATYSDGTEHESSAKRIKLSMEDDRCGNLCPTEESSTCQLMAGPQGDPSEDSGYEASTLESLSTPLRREVGLENMDEMPLHTDMSRDSIDEDVEDEDDDNVSTVSELSGLSDLSGQDWKPHADSRTWIQKQMHNGVDPRSILVDLGVESHQIPQFVDDVTLWKLIINMLGDPPRRHKLRHVNTLDDIVRLLKGAKKIIVLTGAGVSVSCGIPDFRSRDGIYSRLAIDFPDLPDPQAMFDISYFSQDPRPFYKFARDIYPGKFQPSPCHRFIKLLEKHGKLLRNYTQNIDTLEKVADIERVIECHGSFATATCTKCGNKVTAEAIREIVLAQNVPVCAICRPDIGEAIAINELSDREPDELRDLVSSGIMKPDIVFFGEGLPDSFHEAMSEDKNECDLLVVIGSSLKVRPVALIPSSLPSNVPQILINREPLPHCHFDVELLGDCDVIINHLCHMLGSSWEESIYQDRLNEALHLLPLKPTESVDKCNCETSSSCSCFGQQGSNSMTQSIKERHMSVDSARDSGIGENSNFTDVDTMRYDEDTGDKVHGEPKKIQNASDRDSFLNNCELELSSNGFTENNEEVAAVAETASSAAVTSIPTQSKVQDMQGYWQPKEKRSITDRLPANSYYLIQPSRYIFPGAELFYDPDEKCSYFDNASSDSSDSESEAEPAPPDSTF